VIDEPIRVLEDDGTFLDEITINPEKSYQTMAKPKDPETSGVRFSTMSRNITRWR
jgi:hypothetical protein